MSARDRAPSNAVPSPCISVCQLDAAGQICIGCLRTLDEIAAWSTMSDDGKRAVVAELAKRQAPGR